MFCDTGIKLTHFIVIRENMSTPFIYCVTNIELIFKTNIDDENDSAFQILCVG